MRQRKTREKNVCNIIEQQTPTQTRARHRHVSMYIYSLDFSIINNYEIIKTASVFACAISHVICGYT